MRYKHLSDDRLVMNNYDEVLTNDVNTSDDHTITAIASSGSIISTPAPRFFVSINPNVVNKDIEALKRHNKDWQEHPRGYYTQDEFLEQVCVQGHPFCKIFNGGNRTGTDFQKTNVVALDFDGLQTKEVVLSDLWITQHAALIYTTPSYKEEGPHKLRVVFLSERIIEDEKEIVQIQTGLVSKYGSADEKCKDAARLYFGCKGAKHWLCNGRLSEDDISELKQIAKQSTKKEVDNLCYQPDKYAKILSGEIEEGCRNDSFTRLAGHLKHLGLPPAETLQIVLLKNDSLSDPLQKEEVARIVKSVYRYEDKNANAANTSLLTTGEHVCDKTDIRSVAVHELNKKYAMVKLGKDSVIIDETDPLSPSFLSIRGWTQFLGNKFVTYSVKHTEKDGTESERTDKQALSTVWKTHPCRRSYERVVFNIEGSAVNEYNLWKGFTGVREGVGEFSNVKYHIFEVICGSDQASYDYVIQWLAHLVQKPQEKPGVALVMRGKKGVGKGVFANNIIRNLIGDGNFIGIDKAEHLTGHFNKHLTCALVVFADEAFFAGNKQEQNSIKSIITEKHYMMEAKGVDAIEVRSYHRLIMATNSEWVVGATEDERRFLLLDVSDKHKQDRQYFEKLVDAVNNELPAFFYYLKELDISHFDRYNPPKTKALFEQMVYSQDTFESWISEVKSNRGIFQITRSTQYGALSKQETTIVDFAAEGAKESPTDEVYEAYRSFAKDMNERRIMSSTAFGNRLFKEKWLNVIKTRRRSDGKRKYVYSFDPTLPEEESGGESGGDDRDQCQC